MFSGFLWIVIVALLASGVAMALDLKQEKFHVGKMLVPALLAFGVFVFWLSFVTIDAGTRGVVTRFGAVVGDLPPGLHMITPFVEEVHPVSTQTLTVKPSEDAASKDLQMVKTQVTLAYHFDPAYVGYIYQQLSDASENSVENKVIIPAILEAIKACTAKYNAQELIEQRPAVRDGIEAFVMERLRPYHIVAETVSITDFAFSPEFDKSIEAKVKAQQDAEKAENDLNRIKIEAEQKVAQAQAEAKALEVQRQQITPELIQLRTIEMMQQRWDGHLPEVMAGGGQGALPMFDVLKAAKK